MKRKDSRVIYIADNVLVKRAFIRRYKEKYRKKFYTEMNVYTYDEYCFREVTLYWPLIARGNLPEKINSTLSKYILEYIVSHYRMNAGYFADMNMDSFRIASEIYSIMINASRNNISVYDITNRIYVCKMKKRNYDIKEIFERVKDVISTYRKVLGIFGIYDTPLINEMYCRVLAENSRYRKISKNVKTVSVDAEYVNNMAGFSQSEKVFIMDDRDYQNFSEQCIGLENVISELISEKKAKYSDIAVVVPDMSTVYKDIARRVSSGSIYSLKTAGQFTPLYRDDTVQAVLCALALYRGFENVSRKDEKILLLKTVLKDRSFFDISENMDAYISELGDSLKSGYGDISNEEFIKRFFADNFPLYENDVRNIIKTAESFRDFEKYLDMTSVEEAVNAYDGNHLKDRNDFLENANLCAAMTDPVRIFSYIKNNIYSSMNTRRLFEVINSSDICMISYEAYINSLCRRKYTVLYDAYSVRYDPLAESTLDTSLAYEDGYAQMYENEKIAERLMKKSYEYMKKDIDLMKYPDTSYIIIKSDLNISGFEQDNDFYYMFTENGRRQPDDKV